jgi:glycosyltransferase involved in cell wall biosynthesis
VNLPMDISVLIPCHNAVRTVAGAIESVLAQTQPPTEVLVVDDGSSDGSLEVIKRFGESVEWRQQSNQGGGRTRNRLLDMCSTEWVQYLDADDYLLPDKLAEHTLSLSSDPEVDVLYGPSIFEDHAGDRVVRYESPIPEPRDPWLLLARWRLPQTGSPLWRRSALLDVGAWKEDQSVCQEHELYLRLLKAGKRFGYYPRAGSVYRRFPDSTVSTSDSSRTFRARLEITQELERYAEAAGLMTPELSGAVQLSRLEIARVMWPEDPRFAEALAREAKRRRPRFKPRGDAFPLLYRMAYRGLGFRAAETLASWKRILRGR